MTTTAENPFASEDIMPPFNEHWVLRRAINKKLKQLALQLVTKGTGLDALQALDAQLALAIRTLEPGKDLKGREAWIAEGTQGSIRVVSREIAALAGQSNVVAPPMHVWFDHAAKKAYAKVTLDWLYEGPPNCVHGGIVAALFDDFLGCTQLISGKAGATGALNLRYHLPTPLNTELRFESEIKSIEGRKITVTGHLLANGRKTASAEGIFVTIPEGVHNLSKREA